jgi:pimeloyl-ACP methyl ester carboxylesterase
MQFSPDLSHHFQFLRTLGHAYNGAADIGECFETLARITAGDDASWYREWRVTADRLFTLAEGCAAAGHVVSAGAAYLRASNYYRTAEFYLPLDALKVETARRSRESFRKAIPFLPLRVEAVGIPYERTALPGYVITSHSRTGPVPTVLCHSGFDGTGEEVAIGPGFAAAARGYTYIAFEGPGQGRVVREQRLPFRPDWEKVVGAVLDFAVARTDVDGTRVALMGISFGGSLAPRAAAREHRLAALVANGGVYSFYDPIAKRLPLDPLGVDPDQLEAAVHGMLAQSSEARFFVNQGRMCFGVERVHDLFKTIKSYDVTEAGSIRCPTLVVDVEGEHLLPGEARKLFERLACPKTFLLFRASEGADVHCQAGAEAIGVERIFDWLDDVFAGKPVAAMA